MIAQAFNEDCMIGMHRYRDGYFDLAICDPPYGIGVGTMPFVQRGQNAVKQRSGKVLRVPAKQYGFRRAGAAIFSRDCTTTFSMKFSIVINFGPNGGLHLRRNKNTGSFGICLWRLALTCYRYDIEERLPNLESVPSSYLLDYDEPRDQEISAVATLFKDKKPVRWAIRRGSSCMRKTDGCFMYEPSPSNRDDEFFERCRFATAEEAERVYLSFYPR